MVVDSVSRQENNDTTVLDGRTQEKDVLEQIPGKVV
jgi:hypothetical protein